MKTFIKEYLEGRLSPEDLDDFIDEWHQSSDPRELHDAIGVSFFEYSLFVKYPQMTQAILGNYQPTDEEDEEWFTSPLTEEDVAGIGLESLDSLPRWDISEN